MFGAAKVRKYSLTQCSMYTPTAAWQGAIKKVVDENKEQKAREKGESLAQQIDRLSSKGASGEQPSAATLELIRKERATVDLAKYEKVSWYKSVASGVANKAGSAAKMAKNGATYLKDGAVATGKSAGRMLVARNN